MLIPNPTQSGRPMVVLELRATAVEHAAGHLATRHFTRGCGISQQPDYQSEWLTELLSDYTDQYHERKQRRAAFTKDEDALRGKNSNANLRIKRKQNLSDLREGESIPPSPGGIELSVAYSQTTLPPSSHTSHLPRKSGNIILECSRPIADVSKFLLDWVNPEALENFVNRWLRLQAYLNKVASQLRDL
ncbi:2437_t:CDS:2 [Paraglomus brasilianum]|uniref:2437_t:CDS:1 n=1 Tax=Paraglomus brasilianum TaxID=144538 RepID=A0A9N8VQK9_9GLOM|nr:2437_t:CDS:2 [Paraglomus brasilianum]